MPFIVATYVYASIQGQRTHSARTNVWKEGTIVTYKTRTERQFLSSRGELLYAIFVGLWKVLQKKDSAGAFCAPTLVYNLLTTKNTAIDWWTAHPQCPSATLVSDPSRLILTTLFVNILSHAEHFITNIQFGILRIQWFMGRWAGAIYSLYDGLYLGQYVFRII